MPYLVTLVALLAIGRYLKSLQLLFHVRLPVKDNGQKCKKSTYLLTET